MSEQENKITGTITAIKDAEPIANGKYNKLVFAVTNKDGYEGREQLFAFEIFEKSEGDKIANFQKFNSVGDLVDVSYEIRCNENGGRYFTSLSAWKVFKAEGGTVVNAIDSEDDAVLDEEPPF